MDEFGGILELAIKASFKPQTVINGFRVCGLYPFNADAVDYSKCIAGKHDNQTPQNKAGGVEESVLISCRDIQNAISMISVGKAALYRLVEPDDLTNEAEKAVCAVYKTILAPLDERNMPEVESTCEAEIAEQSELQSTSNSPITLDESFGTLGSKDGTTQTDPVIIETNTLDEAFMDSKDMQNSRSSQEQLTNSDCLDVCQ